MGGDQGYWERTLVTQALLILVELEIANGLFISKSKLESGLLDLNQSHGTVALRTGRGYSTRHTIILTTLLSSQAQSKKYNFNIDKGGTVLKELVRLYPNRKIPAINVHTYLHTLSHKNKSEWRKGNNVGLLDTTIPNKTTIKILRIQHIYICM